MPIACACRSIALAAVVAVSAPHPAHATGQDLSLDTILDRLAGWVDDFQDRLSGLVAEEVYEQRVSSRTATLQTRQILEPVRRLRSDFLLVRPMGADRYVEFRDVFEVDGKPLRDREERLTRLFLDPSDAAGTQLQAIISESARYNLGRIVRNVNTPLLSLMFFQGANQPAFTFKRTRSSRPSIEGTIFMGGKPAPTFRETPEMWVLEYEESQRPTFVRSPQGADLPVRGRVWLNPDDGSVIMTELVIDIGDVRTLVDVTYQSAPIAGFLVPSEMRERYVTRGETVEGHATYGRVRRFDVSVEETFDLDAPPRP